MVLNFSNRLQLLKEVYFGKQIDLLYIDDCIQTQNLYINNFYRISIGTHYI